MMLREAYLQVQMTALRAHCNQTQAAKHCGILKGLTMALTEKEIHHD
jgi:hypothetical protein